jgi:chromosome segregation ATPase
MNIHELRKQVEQIKGKRNTIKKLLDKNKTTINQLEVDVGDASVALELIHKAAIQTQSALKFNIETPVTTALSKILDDPYVFELVFDIKRDRTSCDLLFTREGQSIKPKDGSGGTALDIASIALRVAMFQIASKKSSPVFILDEIFKHVSEDKRVFTGEFIKTLCDKLGLQFIMISHDQKHLVSHADRTFSVSMQNKVSNVSY